MNKMRQFPIMLIILVTIGFITCKGKPADDHKADVSEIITTDDNTRSTTKTDKKTIVFFGNSLTAGYQLQESESFPSLIQSRIDSLGMNYQIVNAGLSGETTSGGVNRIDWVAQQKIDIFVLELGANDMLRGLDVSETKANLDKIISIVKNKNPDVEVIIAGMQALPNMGNDYVHQFNSIFPSLATKYNAGLIPFLLQDVAGIPELNLPDGKHPNPQGQKVVRDNVWQVLINHL